MVFGRGIHFISTASRGLTGVFLVAREDMEYRSLYVRGSWEKRREGLGPRKLYECRDAREREVAGLRYTGIRYGHAKRHSPICILRASVAPRNVYSFCTSTRQPVRPGGNIFSRTQIRISRVRIAKFCEAGEENMYTEKKNGFSNRKRGFPYDRTLQVSVAC